MATLKIVELRFRDWAAAVVWFREHFQLNVLMEMTAQHYVLLDAGGVQLAIKGDAAAHITQQVQLQWEVDDVTAWVQAEGATILKPMKISEEGYRRIVVEGPEGLGVLVYDWLSEHSMGS